MHNISKCTNFELAKMYQAKSTNRVNAEGEMLEYFIKDSFCGIPPITASKRNSKYSKVFSYTGGQNNPPDAMIWKSDAIEIKKLKGLNSGTLALNSSYPKAKLFSTSPMITNECRRAEKNWKEKDMLYAVGNMERGKLAQVTFAYGDCFVAKNSTYEKPANAIRSALKKSNLVLRKTTELGKVKGVDPLKNTDLRIRSMWHITSPTKLFKEQIGRKDSDTFLAAAILRSSKYQKFPSSDKKLIQSGSFQISETDIADPDNNSKKIRVKLIVYR